MQRPPSGFDRTLRIASNVAISLSVGLALLVATQLRMPYLAAARGQAFWALILGGGTVLAFTGLALWRGARSTRLRLTFVAAGLMVAVPTYTEWGFYRARDAVLRAPSEVIEPFSRHVILGYRSVDELRRILERTELAGIFITSRNVFGRSVAEVRAEIESLQAIQAARGRPPLLVAADHEGGIISRLSPPLAPVPALGRVADDAGAAWRAAVVEYGRAQGRDLASLGVNLNFAPVVDLRADQTPSLDLHSQIALRAIAADPERVAAVATAYAGALWQSGVLPTAKHFPGLGSVQADTHHVRGHLTRSRDQLAAAEWRPFRALAANRNIVVMVGHVVVDALDAANLASTSEAVIAGALRQSVGHDGLVVTDDLCMTPIVYGEGGVAGNAWRSLRAGADLLLITWDPELVYPMLAGMLERQADATFGTRLRASAVRIAAVREQLAQQRAAVVGEAATDAP